GLILCRCPPSAGASARVSELPHLVSRHRRDVRTGAAVHTRCTPAVAGDRRWLDHYGTTVHDRKIADRALSGPCRARVALRSGWIGSRCNRVGVLFRTDLSVRRGVHAGPCQPNAPTRSANRENNVNFTLNHFGCRVTVIYSSTTSIRTEVSYVRPSSVSRVS